MRGPAAPVIDANPDHVPIALPRSAPVNVALINASDSGTANAPPIPWTHRAAIKNTIVSAARARFRSNQSERD